MDQDTEKQTASDPIDRLALLVAEDAQEGEGTLDTAIRLLEARHYRRAVWRRQLVGRATAFDPGVLYTFAFGAALGIFWGVLIGRK